ncbi:DUF99 family protein [Halorussus gelatinilyticus]|uniref:UPF0215 protein M0R88_05225 n=1 Tax=Halorussus gelatinilyticus TaxID=2937524 RepID=A0A8U0IK41_9EURY|nr:DUF99 family protein [Halorussus gelatinilyticus]UPW01507.1 DUF99 family protein [Halorussus gelatinilyticus]
MKPGVRALGVAESYRERYSTLAGAVTRASRVTDGFAFETCTVGGTDATAAVADLFSSLGREDVRYVFVAGIALAWYNVVDLRRLAAEIDRPVISVTFEESPGLLDALEAEFEGDALERRRETFERQPPRERLGVNDQTVFVRPVGIDASEARDVVRAFTPEGGRPEPLRVARLAARAGDDLRRESERE